MSPKLDGKTACRMHGGAKGTGRESMTAKYKAPMIILDEYNRALGDPELLTLSHEIATLIAYTNHLFDLLEQHNIVLAHENVMVGVESIRSGIINQNFLLIREGLKTIQDSLDPIFLTVMAWKEIKGNYEIQTKMVTKQREWLEREDEAIPRQHVLELMIWMNRIGMKYIKARSDREAFGNEILALIPRKPKVIEG